MKLYPEQIAEAHWFYKLDQLKKETDVVKLSSFEASFLDDRWKAQEEFGEYMRLSEKQKDVLRNICRKMNLGNNPKPRSLRPK